MYVRYVNDIFVGTQFHDETNLDKLSEKIQYKLLLPNLTSTKNNAMRTYCKIYFFENKFISVWKKCVLFLEI